ncbi:MAG: C39 family peptidase [Anaerolineaceae bacterium]|nr:C39 family peptidase [Anaerolineaceae bacterium]
MRRHYLKRILFFLIIPLLFGLGACQTNAEAVLLNESEPSANDVAQVQSHTSEPTHTLVPTETLTQTITMTTTPAETATPISTATPEIPDEYYITDIAGYRQFFSLSCESRCAVDWAAYFDVTIYEFNFQHELPLSDNPDFGFVGTVNGPWGQIPPYAYGVHAEPVAALLRDYGLKAVAYKKYSIEQLRQQIAAGHPVIVWVIGNVEGGIPHIYTDSQGNEVQVGAYEHVVIVTGYGKDSIRYLNNSRFYDVPVDVFDNSWSVLDRMVVVWED